MKACQKDVITYVHLFTQQSWLEDWGPDQGDQWLAFSQAWPVRAPPRLRITIRHTDWWYDYLGENRPLALDPKRKGEARVGEWVGAGEGFERDSWGARFENLKGVRVLELEVETVRGKRGELDHNLEMAPTWRFRLGDGNLLVLDEGATERWEWVGSRHVKGLGMKDVPAGLQWTRKGSRASKTGTPRNNSLAAEEELAVEDRLEYYVVLLTWRAKPAKEVEEEDAATAKEKKENEEAELAIGRSSTNTSATVPAPPPVAAPVIRPRVLYNRFNAPPTYYG